MQLTRKYDGIEILANLRNLSVFLDFPQYAIHRGGLITLTEYQ